MTMPASGMAPLAQKFEVELAPAAVGAESSGNVRAPFDGTVTGVTYVAAATMTGAATNNRTLSVVNRGQAGVGTTVVASLAFVDNTVIATAYDEKALTLSVVAGATAVVAGDVLEFRSLHIGIGIAEPGGTAYIEITRG
jgi:hypothetical protein